MLRAEVLRRGRRTSGVELGSLKSFLGPAWIQANARSFGVLTVATERVMSATGPLGWPPTVVSPPDFLLLKSRQRTITEAVKETENSHASPVGAFKFTTTHWSVVVMAQEPDSPHAAEALERLCRTYWYPLYAFVRRQGCTPEDAQDLTQEFFARLLAKNYLAQVERQKGKFRSFLLAALRHFLSDQRDRARAVKRGGGADCLSLDAQTAEERYHLEPVDRMDAEKTYERRWAMTLLEQALTRLRDENVAAGKAVLFERLRSFVAGETDSSCAEAAAQLALTESALKSALHRLRQRYRELVREEIAHTVADPAEIDDELSYLIAVMTQ